MKKFKIFSICMLVAVLAMLVLTACNRNGDDDTPAQDPPAATPAPPADDPAADDEEEEDEEEEPGEPCFRTEVPATLRMSWWGGEARHEAIVAAVRHFESENPHIRVEANYDGWDGYHTSLTIQIMAGDPPDLFSFGGGYRLQYSAFLRDYAEYMHLFPFLEERRGMLTSHTYMVGDRIVGVPAGIGAFVTAYSKTLFDRAGVPHPTHDMTMVEWLDMLEALAEGLGPGYFWDSGWYWFAGHQALGAGEWGMPPTWIDFTNFETQPPRLNLDLDIHRRTWTTVEHLWNIGIIPRAGDDEVSMAVGNAIFESTTTPRATAESTEMELGFILPPRRWDADSPVIRGVPGPGLFWGVPLSTDNPLQAMYLLEFLQTDPTAVELIGFTVGTPTLSASLEHLRSTLEPGSYEYMQLYIAQMGNENVDIWVDHPAVAGGPEATEAFRQVLSEFIFGVIDLETFLVNVIDEVQRAFDIFFIPLTD